MKRLEGQVAVVSGGNSGVALATAKHLQLEGAKAAISGRNEKTLDEAARARLAMERWPFRPTRQIWTGSIRKFEETGQN